MTEPILAIEVLHAGYGSNQVLRGLSLTLEKGAICGLIGPNGAGKTTLLRAVYGLLPAQGRVRLNGRDITQMPAQARRQAGLSYVLQERNVFPNLTVAENLEMAFHTIAPAKAAASFEQRCDFLYDLFPVLAERRGQLAGLMSGGQQRAVAIGMGLIHQPEVILLDEPTTGLAPLVVHGLMDTIKRLNTEAGVTTLIIEQNILSMLRIVTDLHVLKNGVCKPAPGGVEAIGNQKIWEYL